MIILGRILRRCLNCAGPGPRVEAKTSRIRNSRTANLSTTKLHANFSEPRQKPLRWHVKLRGCNAQREVKVLRAAEAALRYRLPEIHTRYDGGHAPVRWAKFWCQQDGMIKAAWAYIHSFLRGLFICAFFCQVLTSREIFPTILFMYVFIYSYVLHVSPFLNWRFWEETSRKC